MTAPIGRKSQRVVREMPAQRPAVAPRDGQAPAAKAFERRATTGMDAPLLAVRNKGIPPAAQRQALTAILSRIEQPTTAAKGHLVLFDRDMTTETALEHMRGVLAGIGDTYNVREFKRDQVLDLIPGYTEEHWAAFVKDMKLEQNYPNLNWGSGVIVMDANGHFSPPAPRGPLYSTYRSSYWGRGGYTKDVITPGLGDFMKKIEARGATGAFTSNSPFNDGGAHFKAAGIENPTLFVGETGPDRPAPRPFVRDGDAQAKWSQAYGLMSEGYEISTIVDDRPTNRAAIEQAVRDYNADHGTNFAPPVSVAIAPPGITASADAQNVNGLRVSTFELE